MITGENAPWWRCNRRHLILVVGLTLLAGCGRDVDQAQQATIKAGVLQGLYDQGIEFGIDSELLLQSIAPQISPIDQVVPSPGEEAKWTIEVFKNPKSPREFRFDYGDGSSSTVTLPEGTGVAVHRMSKVLPVGHHTQMGTVVDVEEPRPEQPLTARAVTEVRGGAGQ